MGTLDKRFPRYSRLLHLFPAPYRRVYGQQMLETLADMLDDPSQRPAAVWLRTTIDFPISLARQQLTYTGGAMKTTPAYLKRSALLGAWMVAPFFLLIALNTLTNQRLHNSVFWHTSALFVWLLVLPAVAAILNLAALLRWIQERRRQSHQSAFSTITDFRRSWPVLGVAVVALGIIALVFGHDSVHCVLGNPITEISRFHHTWQCIQTA